MRAARLALVSAVMLAGQWAGAQGAQVNETSRYYIAFLRPDPARKALSKEEGDRIQTAHMTNIHKMADDAVLVSAGPFEDTPLTISGIFIFKVESLERAREIALKDPTVVEHRNTIDVHEWDGPSGIGEEYTRLHQLDPKTPENMQVHPFCMLFRERADDVPKEVMAAHGRYVEKLKADGKLSAAGRVNGEDGLAGLVVFRAISLEEAERLLGEDPAVKAGVFRVEYHHWWSSDHVLPW
jgi:uncharacterized protein YciI